MTSTRGFFTDEAKVAELRRMAAENIRPDHIAIALGTTKNTVVSAAKHRGIKLATIDTKLAQSVESVRRASRLINKPPKPDKSASQASPIPMPKIEAPGPNATDLITAITNRLCKWAVGPDDGEQLFCGDPADGNYCDRHQKKSGCAAIPEYKRRKQDKETIFQQARSL